MLCGLSTFSTHTIWHDGTDVSRSTNFPKRLVLSKFSGHSGKVKQSYPVKLVVMGWSQLKKNAAPYTEVTTPLLLVSHGVILPWKWVDSRVPTSGLVLVCILLRTAG